MRFLTITFFYFFPFATCELFTAMTHLEPLVEMERTIGDKVDDYIELEMKRIEKLREMADNYKKSYKQKLETLDELTRNPLGKFQIMKRLTLNWQYMKDYMVEDDAPTKFLGNITGLPDSEDLSGAATAIFRIQDVYRLLPTDMADGRIPGLKQLEKMSAHDCFELGRQAYNAEDYYHTVQWMEESLARFRKEKKPTVSERDVLDYLSYALYQQGNLQQAWHYAKRQTLLFPDDKRAQGNVEYYAKEMDKEGFKKSGSLPPITNMRPTDPGLPEREIYEALCRGQNFKSEKEKTALTCYYKRDRPFLKLAPIKVEVVHLKPLAVLFKDVLSDREIDMIKSIATPLLKRATVHNKATGQLEHASYRITKSAWLKNDHHPYIERINKRLEDMTNLDQDLAEDFQVANYGLGGHYDPHFDHATSDEEDPFEEGQGNRIATVLFYVEQPIAGGATVFINAKLTCYPSKYDALFWYNLLPNGEGDDRTRHAACPVLAGQKWVSNKWIHERTQEFRRPCTPREKGEEGRVREVNAKDFATNRWIY